MITDSKMHESSQINITETTNEIANEEIRAKYIIDFSIKFFKSSRIFEYKIDGKWILFAPDWPGHPVVVDNSVYYILNLFKNGAKVSDVFNQMMIVHANNIEFIINAISFLEKRGFIRESHSELPYSLPLKFPFKVSKSLTVWLHITNKCNLSCSYCFIKDKSETHMDEDKFKTISRALVNAGKAHEIKSIQIKFAGGEPTLETDLIERFQNILENDLNGSGIELNTTILSNGTVINDRLISFLKRPNTGIGISVDGIGPYHDLCRVFKNSKSGSWNIILKNLELLKNKGINFSIMATINKETCKGLSELLKFSYKNKIRANVGIVREFDISHDPTKYESICRDMKEAFNKAFMELENPDIYINSNSIFDIEELHFNFPSDGVSCGIGRSHLVIKTNGNIVSCPILIDHEGISPSTDILESCKYCFKFDPFERKYESIGSDCVNCLWFPVCSGGCSIMNLKANGYPFTKSPMCDFYRYIIPRYIIFFGTKLIQAANKRTSSKLKAGIQQ